MALYNCRHSEDQYRISKFDEDMNVESSYLCTTEECECPAGQRPTCRHRAMLPQFLAREHVGDEWFFDHDRGGWVQMDLPQPTEEQTFLEGMSQEVTTFNYMEDGSVQVIDHKPEPAPQSEFMKRRFL